MKYHIEMYHLFCWRLRSPADVNFFKTGWWNSNAHYSWSHYNSSTIIQKHLDFSTPQSHLVSLVSLWKTLYSEWRLTLEKFWTFYSLSFLVNILKHHSMASTDLWLFLGQSYDFQAPCERMDISWLWKILKDVSQSHIWWQMNAPDLHITEIVVESGSLWIIYGNWPKQQFCKLPRNKWPFYDITVNFIIQKSKSKHLIFLSFFCFFLRERKKIFYTFSGP